MFYVCGAYQAGGMDKMSSYTIAFPSATYAAKAARLLGAEGIRTEIIRTPRTLAKGCGYSVIAYAEADRTAKILEDSGMNYRAVSEGHR